MTATDIDRAAPRYRFAGSDDAVWLGLRPLPLLALGLALSAAVALLYLGAPVLPALGVVGLGVTVAIVPVAGRVAVEWTAPLSRHAAATALAQRDWSAGVPTLLIGDGQHRSGPVRLPREYGRLRVTDAADGALGVIEDRQARAVTAVFAVAGADRFALLDPAEQTVRLAGWGTALAALAADPQVRAVQWVERAGPDLRDPAGWLRDRTDRAASGAGAADDTAAAADYAAMTAGLAATAIRHEIWLAVQLRCGARSIPLDAIADRVRDIAGILLTADLLARPLPTADIGWLLRRFTDHTVTDQTGTDPAGIAAGAGGGPSSRRTDWCQLRTDDSWHRSFAVTGWPRIPVTAGWLEPLLAAASPHAVRTLSVHLAPVAAAPAARQARAARTRARLDGADRARFGFADATSTAWAEADAASTEEELLAGYRLHRVTGVLTCSAATVAALDEACRTVRAAATGARVDLRPLHGQHDAGFLASLPLCRTNGLTR